MHPLKYYIQNLKHLQNLFSYSLEESYYRKEDELGKSTIIQTPRFSLETPGFALETQSFSLEHQIFIWDPRLFHKISLETQNFFC